MKAITQLSLASLIVTALACGGGGSEVITPANLHYSAPTRIVTKDGNGDITISDVSSNGIIVGTLGSQGYYWTSPASSPIPLSNGMQPQVVNSHGAMAGYQAGSDLAFASSPTATPVALARDAASTNKSVFLKSMTDTNAILGQASNVSSPEEYAGIFWDNSHQVQTIASSPGSSEYVTVGNSKDGSIFGIEFDSGAGSFGRSIRWANYATTGVFVDGPSLSGPGAWSVVSVNRDTGVSVALNFDDQQTYYGVGYLPSGSTTILQMPGSGVSPVAISNNGIVIGGAKIDSNGLFQFPNVTPMVWANVQSDPVDLNTLIPSGTGWVLGLPKYILANGDIIGQGKLTVSGVTTDEWYYIQRK
ncbi:MAG: hypothetical protein JST12_02325 [Armatimonadetes bacterium]|nr:hypothetical protein [Armatimonadota bacterium]MBS1725266.1 hypothetical protein [Armatimonadota bacterium]